MYFLKLICAHCKHTFNWYEPRKVCSKCPECNSVLIYVDWDKSNDEEDKQECRNA
jgi:transcription initiation factor IIE alpha subunit